MFERETLNKKNAFDDKQHQLADARKQRVENMQQLQRAKHIWENKTQETDQKILIRENMIKERQNVSEILCREIADLKKMLEEVDDKVFENQNKRQTILNDI